jgi:hypothetical protein
MTGEKSQHTEQRLFDRADRAGKLRDIHAAVREPFRHLKPRNSAYALPEHAHFRDSGKPKYRAKV